jgi:hypothetical protein
MTHGHCKGRRSTKHAKRESPTYRVWRCMVQRTTNPNNSRFGTYAGKVDPSFLGKGGFARFLACVGKRPSLRHSLDRIDPHGSYEPGNLRWATRRVQRRNVREYERVFYGRPISEWAKLQKVTAGAIRKRLERKTDHTIVVPPKWRLAPHVALDKRIALVPVNLATLKD